MPLLQSRGEIEQVHQPAARHANVLIQLGQSCRLERGAELAAQTPERLARGRRRSRSDVESPGRSHERGERVRF